jgi:selenophosphate synthetase-related protein
MTLEGGDWSEVQAAFAFEGVRCERIGQVNASGSLRVRFEEHYDEFWNLREQAFTGFSFPHLDLSPLTLTEQEH